MERRGIADDGYVPFGEVEYLSYQRGRSADPLGVFVGVVVVVFGCGREDGETFSPCLFEFCGAGVDGVGEV